MAYASWRDIVAKHGIIVFILYFLMRLTQVAPNRLWAYVGRAPIVRDVVLQGGGTKVKPWWQDLFVIVTAAVTVFVAAGAARGTPSYMSELVAWVLLLDMLSYHVRVLWFDDLTPNRSWSDLRVFSHRRILFQAFINFIELVFLFSALYVRYGCWSGRPSSALQTSFAVATTLSPPESLARCSSVANTEVIFSLFFLVIVISIVASVGYTRRELAPHEEDAV